MSTELRPEPEPTPDALAELGAMLPRRRRVHFRDRAGELEECDVILATRAQWKERPERDQPGWGTLRFGPLVLALRVTR